MRNRVFIISAVLGVCFSACKNDKRIDEATKMVVEWTGKEIIFPENTPCYISDKETLQQFCDDNFQKEFKILLYVDSAGCSACRLMLSQWKHIIEEADSLFPGKVGFLPFFQPKNINEIAYLFARDKFKHPVFMDFKNVVNQLNQFPQSQLFQCFLLDSENKVLVIGNPALNPKIWEIYKSQIGGNVKSETGILTTVKVDKTIHSYGTIRKDSTSSADFSITNIGNAPLVILRVSGSCGCIRATWDKQPIAPGHSTSIRVEMTPDETGQFNKTAVVYCNTNESSVMLTVVGTSIE